MEKRPYHMFPDLLTDKNHFDIYTHCKKSYKDFVAYFVNKNIDGSLNISETSYTHNCIGIISSGIFLPFDI